MADKGRIFCCAGLILSCIATIAIITSFASPYWVEAQSSVSSKGFDNMGLWVICFDNYFPPHRPVTQKKYTGCHQAISYEMRDLKDYFFPCKYQSKKKKKTGFILGDT